MYFKIRMLFCIIFSFLQFHAFAQDIINFNLVNKKVERNIDISSQIVEVTTEVIIENTAKEPASYVLFSVEPEARHHLAYIGAVSQEEGKPTLRVFPSVVADNKKEAFWRIELKTPLQTGRTVTIKVETVFTHFLVPYPSQITQSEHQLVYYQGNHYYYSPYLTKTQTTKLTLASNSVESYTKLKPVSQADSTVTYGPYENVGPMSFNKMTIHSENNNPFLAVSKLHRTLEVSHWGVISVEEEIDIHHIGAVLKGPFSRYDYQRDQSGVSSVKVFKTVLPASAMDVYYRDEIGNISTSHMRVLDDSVELELRPRFPLFGGWKTHYVLGYYVPTYEYLFNSGDYYVLKMRFVDHVFDDSVIDHAEVKIILPEGVKDIQLKLSYQVQRKSDQLHFTYLDTIGRPVIVLEKSNLVEQHIQDFEIHYKFQKILMLQEPLLVVIALYLLFILVIIYVRLDFTISWDPQRENRLHASGLVERILKHQDKLSDIYFQYDAALMKYKVNKDNASYQVTVKKLNSDHKNEVQAIAEALSKMKQDGSELVEKVSELQRLDRNLKEQFHHHMTLVEKLISGKMNKLTFVESEAAITRKKEELAEKLQTLTNFL
ncbi:dolichyl-diphosphooligosaccharide--protein glycosyltransferase subunit 1 [Tachypleus tridentatus]|uniref:dolichyl-diphosphooligosaccharide--protein glycosyltransferase subunit 1 n=1 Tax=Tachypleus tridentatus TaxID=6853 RepID=UPI003FD39D4D